MCVFVYLYKYWPKSTVNLDHCVNEHRTSFDGVTHYIATLIHQQRTCNSLRIELTIMHIEKEKEVTNMEIRHLERTDYNNRDIGSWNQGS